MKIKKLVYLSSLLAFALLFATSNVYAASLRIADSNSGNVNIGQNEKIKNLYTAGNLVSIDANVQKGVHAVGNVVTINGNVGGTVYSGAGTLFINGTVGGSVHGGGGSIIINNSIANDLFMGGGHTVISKSASVGDDLFIGGGTIDIQGPVYGNAYIGGGVVTINSEIHGNVKIVSADKLKLGSNAKINGNLEYNSKNKIEIEEGALVLGETSIINKKSEAGSDKDTMFSALFAIISIAILIKLLGLIIVGLLLIYVFKNITESTVKEGVNNLWKSFGTGLVLVFIIPIIMVLLFVTIIGIWPGIILGILYILSILLAISFAGITFGSWLVKIIGKNENYPINWKVVVGGVLALMLIKVIPIIGGVIGCIFVLTSLGAIYRFIYKLRK